jgi:hypothetical protein
MRKALKGEAFEEGIGKHSAKDLAVEKSARDPAALDQYNQDNGKFIISAPSTSPEG